MTLPQLRAALMKLTPAHPDDQRLLGERLFCFGLLDRWDASSDETRKVMRSKLGAA